MKRLAVLSLMLAGCGGLPQDAAGTTDRIANTHVIRVGIVDGRPQDVAMVAALIRRIGADAKARPVIAHGAGEVLIAAMDEDRIDLVIASFAKDSPWRPEVAFAPPIAAYAIGQTQMFVRAATRNGENRWIMLVEKASRETASQLADQG